eukprot:g4031.t1
MFSSFLTTKGGEQVRPVLLVRSGKGTPNWISPLECQKLAPGTSIFECCANNHIKIKECVRSVCLKSLDELIGRRVCSLFASRNFAEARFTLCMRNYWCRGLLCDATEKSWISLDDFKNELQWDSVYDDMWIDREDFPLLAYAASSDCLDIVQLAITEIDRTRDKSLISARVPKCGIVELGMPGGCTALNLAMMLSRTEIVSRLLEHGADPYEIDLAGHDAFMMASIFGRIDNVKYWLSRFPDWNVERKNKLGGAALDMAVMMGPNRLELVKLLLESGASMDYRSAMGGSIFIDMCQNEDRDLHLLQLLLDKKRTVSGGFEETLHMKQSQVVWLN